MVEPQRHKTGPGDTSLTLLQRLRANEPAAWQTMVQLYLPLVYHWCGRSGVRGAHADDVSQEVFQAATTSLAAFRRDRPGDSFRAWLRGITRHVLLAHFRRTGRQPQGAGGTDAMLQLAEVPDAIESETDTDVATETDSLFRRALDLMRTDFEEPTWQAFWLTVVESQPPVEVAPRLGMTTAAVRKAKSRVLHRLKEEFGELIQ